MDSYFIRMCVAAAAGVTLSTMGVAGASASGAALPARQAVQASAAGPSLAAASPGTQLWAKRYNGPGNNADVATSVAVSPTGKTVYVTGQSYGTALVVDYATVAYNAATGARQWVARYNGPPGSLSNVPSSVVVSPNGKEVFVTGESIVSQLGNYATVAYDAATGHQLWVKGYNGPGNNDNGATAAAVSPTSGTVYVTGFSWGKGTATDYATIAYNAATGAQRWVRRYNGPPGNNYDNANSIAVSPTTGTVYVTGESVGTTSGYDYATVAYDPAGRQLWVKRYTFPGGNTDDAHSVAVSPDGKTVYVTGQSWGGASAWDYATVAYNAATGAQRWVKRYNGPGNAYDLANSVTVSPNSRTVYVTGQSAGAGTGADYATVAYNAATGTQLWVKRYNDTGNGTDIATSMAVNRASGTVYVTGQSVGSSYATVAYTATGTQRWTKRAAGSVLYADSIAVSPTTGTVFVTGSNAGDYTTIAYKG